jgi:hypothetical protein
MKEDYTDSLINVWLEQVDLVQVNLTYKTLMAKLKHYSGVDMSKDYVQEFNEQRAEEQVEELKVTEKQKECDALTSGCQGS